MGNDTTDLTLGTESENKTVTAYYEKLADIKIEYVDEGNPNTVIYSMVFTGDSFYGNEDYDFSYQKPVFWGYVYDAAKTDESELKGTFKSVDEVTSPVVIQVMYKKTGTDTNSPSDYVNAPLGANLSNLSDKTGKTHEVTGQSTDASGTKPSTDDQEVFGNDGMPEAAVKISGDKNTPSRFENYTLVGSAGFQTQMVKDRLTTMGEQIANQPVRIFFVDDTAGNTIISSVEIGDFDPSTNTIPVGAYDTSTVEAQVEPQLLKEGYRPNGINGMTTGSYDEMYRNVYYHYVHTISYGTATSTRTINFQDENGKTVSPSVTQTVKYLVATDNVAGKSVYTPQNAYYQVDVPSVDGYTTNQTVVAQTPVMPSVDKPQNVTETVVYTPIEDTAYTLVPVDENGTTIGTVENRTGQPGGAITDTPTINGYTLVPNQKLMVPDNGGKVEVIYKADDQAATVNYIDDVTNKTVASVSLTGQTNTDIDFSLSAKKTAELEEDGYELVSDDTQKGAVYDNNTASVQKFIIHLTEKIDGPVTPVDPAGDNYGITHKTFTVSVTANNPAGITKDLTPQNAQQNILYTRTVTTNEVTKAQQFGAWQLAGTGYATVVATPLDGYQANPTSIDEASTGLTEFAKNVNDTDGHFTAVVNYTALSHAYTLVPITVDGTPIGDSQTGTGITGDPITDFPTIDGYTPVPDQKVTVPEGDTTVTVTYVPNTDGPTDNGGTTNPGTPTDNGGATNPGTPTDNGGTTNPGTPTDNGGTTNPGTPTDNGGTTNPGTPTNNGGTTNPGTPTDNGGATNPGTPTNNGTSTPGTPTNDGIVTTGTPTYVDNQTPKEPESPNVTGNGETTTPTTDEDNVQATDENDQADTKGATKAVSADKPHQAVVTFASMTGKSSDKANAVEAKLPQTNETSDKNGAIIGMSLLAGLLGLFGFAKKSRKNN